MKTSSLTILLVIMSLCFASNKTIAQSTTAIPDQQKASYALIKRIVPAHANDFEVVLIPKDGNNDVFAVESKNNKIILRGNNGVSIASAFYYYLKNYTHCDISWNGTNLNMPAKLPVVTGKVHITTPYKYRYYLNYCTFSYTMSWWDWDRWQWEIDWMAMNGINMPLALTGQNIIWDRVYKSLGLTAKDLDNFFTGPAYFGWFWMGNIDGLNGPLPQSFMKQQEELQKKILTAERSLGMTPILPAFTGHVPESFKSKFPQANVQKVKWHNWPEVSILGPNDPMFTTIGKKFLEEQEKTFGTDHFYTADPFNENTPPSNDSIYLDNISKKVYQSMAEFDPKATWFIQGWTFLARDFWKPTQIKAFLNAVPNDKLLVLDLFSESKPVWNRTDAYYGKPWIWCMLHNFGGNISMFGRMDKVAKDVATVREDPAAGKLTGIGLTPEAIEQNPVMYALMLDNVWRRDTIDVQSWLNDYALRRYGKKNEDAQQAWSILRKTVYNGGISAGGPESSITGRPAFTKKRRWNNTQKTYKHAALIPAWDRMMHAVEELKSSDGFQYDLLDITRQVMANYADDLKQSFFNDYNNKDTSAFKKHSEQYLAVITDMDKLLATRKDFLLGVWLNTAKAMGTNESEKKLYELNARNQITLWGSSKDSPLFDYSCRQWSGLLNNFYKPRWQQFFNYVNSQLQQNKPVDENDFDSSVKEWEWKWVNSAETYTDKPVGNTVEIAKKMYAKYAPLIKHN